MKSSTIRKSLRTLHAAYLVSFAIEAAAARPLSRKEIAYKTRVLAARARAVGASEAQILAMRDAARAAIRESAATIREAA